MSDPTPAEIETGAEALSTMLSDGVATVVSAAVLRAVLPGHDARLRAQVAEEIADHPGPDPSPALPTWWAGYTEAIRDAAAIARAHTTGGDHG